MATNFSLILNSSNDVVELVNTMFSEHQEFAAEPRFSSDVELCADIGSNGLCAVLLEKTRAAAEGGGPIACAVAREWG